MWKTYDQKEEGESSLPSEEGMFLADGAGTQGQQRAYKGRSSHWATATCWVILASLFTVLNSTESQRNHLKFLELVSPARPAKLFEV